jgi:hypothetical protein
LAKTEFDPTVSHPQSKPSSNHKIADIPNYFDIETEKPSKQFFQTVLHFESKKYLPLLSIFFCKSNKTINELTDFYKILLKTKIKMK